MVSGAPISLASGLLGVHRIGSDAGGDRGWHVEGRLGLGLMAAMDLLLVSWPSCWPSRWRRGSARFRAAAMLAAGLLVCRPMPDWRGLDPGGQATGDDRRGAGHGSDRREIVVRHILPNILTPLIVQSTIGGATPFSSSRRWGFWGSVRKR